MNFLSHIRVVRRLESGKIQISFSDKRVQWNFIKTYHPDIAEAILSFKDSGIVFEPPILMEKESFLRELGVVINV